MKRGWARLVLGAGLMGVPIAATAAAAEVAGKQPVGPVRTIVDLRRQDRLKATRGNLVAAYERVGEKDPKWDGPVRKCLLAAAEQQVFGSIILTAQQRTLAESSHAAVEAGCTDPLVDYLHARYHRHEGVDAAQRLAQLIRTAERLQASAYPAMQKFHACLYVAELNMGTANGKKVTTAEARVWQKSAQENLVAALQEPATEVADATDACLALLRAAETNAKLYEEHYRALEMPLFQHWPEKGGAFLVKGAFQIKYAWFARGSGYANTVTELGGRLFAERLQEARAALDRAWALDSTDPRICYNQLTVELGMGEVRADMERWFERGMNLDPNDYDLCRHKLYYLEPKWHGSPEDMVRFGRECVVSPRWGGRVPLILVDAYDKIATYLDEAGRAEMWRNPGVWKDVRFSYERYFELNPRLTLMRNSYAQHALRCGQAAEFLRQIELLGTAVNPTLFGGRARLDALIREAKSRVGAP